MAKRVRKFRLFPIALSPASLAEALGIERRKIDGARKALQPRHSCASTQVGKVLKTPNHRNADGAGGT